MRRWAGIITVASLTLALTASPALSKRGKKKKDAEEAPTTEAVAEPEVEAEPEPNTTGEHAGIVGYRHTLLESVAKHFGMSKMILQGKVAGRDADLVAHARAIHAASNEFVAMFPEGSGPTAYPQTDALDAIWTDWAGFEAKAGAFAAESAEFLKLAEAGDMEGAKAQFGKVGGSCGGCHESFRKDDH